MHELATRLTDGIDVRLLWRQSDNRVVVTVDDAKTGDSYVLNVGSDENAMDVFHHPYAYAAWQQRRCPNTASPASTPRGSAASGGT